MNVSDSSTAGVRWEGATFGVVPHWLLGKVKPSAVVVYLALTTWADRVDGRAFPGISGICQTASLSEPTVRAAIRELEAVGAVRVESRYRPDGTQTTNNYWLRATPNPGVEEAERVQDSERAEGARILNPNELEPVELEPVGDTSLRSVSPGPADEAAKRLADLIANNGSRRPTITAAWVTELERMHRIDGRTWEEIHGAIEWSQRHEFWASVILSPKKLRAKFDQMRLQATRDQRRSNPARDAYEKFMTDDRGLL